MALDDLVRYESAAVAMMNMEKEADLSVIAMDNLYKTILGKDYDDPIYQRAFAEAKEGVESGAGITNLGIVQSIKVYSQKYEKAFQSLKLSEVSKYLTEGYKISDEVKTAFEEVKDLTVADVLTKAKDNASLKKLSQAIAGLQDRRLRAKTLDIYNEVIKQNLNSLYPKQENKEGDKK